MPHVNFNTNLDLLRRKKIFSPITVSSIAGQPVPWTCSMYLLAWNALPRKKPGSLGFKRSSLYFHTGIQGRLPEVFLLGRRNLGEKITGPQLYPMLLQIKQTLSELKCTHEKYNQSVSPVNIVLLTLAATPCAQTKQVNPSHNHLSHALSAECLACNKVLVLEASNGIAQRCEQHNHTCCDKTAGCVDHAKNLENTHSSVETCSHVVGRDLANNSIEFG